MNVVQEVLNTVTTALTQNMPGILLAVVILIVGWLAAVVLSALVRKVLSTVGINARLARLTGTEGGDGFDVERWAGRIVFWLIIVLVLGLIAQQLQPADAGPSPFAELSNKVLNEYLPQLVGAGLILLVTWLIASVIRMVVLRLAAMTRFDERLAEWGGLEEDQPLAVSSSLATAAFWLTFLLALPAVLSALGDTGLLTSVQGVTTTVLGYIPTVLGAAVTLFVGWIAARIVRQIAENLLVSAGLDKFGEQIGFGQAEGSRPLSRLVGTIVYALVLLTAAKAALDTFNITAVTDLLQQVLDLVPTIIGAMAVLALFYWAGRFVGDLVASALYGVGFNAWPERLGLSDGPIDGERSPSEVAGLLTTAAILLFGAGQAAEQMEFTALANAFNRMIEFGGNVFLAGAVFVLGLFLANLARTAILTAGGANASLYARIAGWAVTIFIGATALQQLGIGAEIVELAFGLVLGALALGFALAVGLGGRDVAARRLEQWMGPPK